METEERQFAVGGYGGRGQRAEGGLMYSSCGSAFVLRPYGGGGGAGD